MKIIINVDDLGIHPAVTRAVNELAKLNIVTSASLLANSLYPIEPDSFPQNIGIGAHLNILRGTPISKSSKVKSLTNNQGAFLGNYKKLFMRYIQNNILLKEVEYEWSQQIEYLIQKGFKLTHLDSEKHIHCWPKLSPITCHLAKKYKIPWVRKPFEKTGLFKINSGKIRTTLLNIWCKSFPKNPLNFSFPDYVWGIANQGKKLVPHMLDKYLSRLPKDSIVEIVCHPGNYISTDPDLNPKYGKTRIKELWLAEYESLKNLEWLEVFKKHNAQIVNFGEI